MYYLAVLAILIAVVAFAALNTPQPYPNCNPPFSIAENLNMTISDKESAYNQFMSLEPGFDHESDEYLNYKNSLVSDINYTEISVSGSGKTYAYVLKGFVAIDSDGQVYRRVMGCI